MIGPFRGEYKWLSNFYRAPFKSNDVIYPTVEHYFQAWKCKDKNSFDNIVQAKTPGTAKKLGHHVVLRSDWEEVNYNRL